MRLFFGEHMAIAKTLSPTLLFATATMLLASVVGSAAAELPKHVYEKSRAEADAVLVVTFSKVERPDSDFSRATCTVHGRVSAVERGQNYFVGQKVTFMIPCVGSRLRPIPGPFSGYDAEQLAGAVLGRFFLKGGDLVSRGYDQLSSQGTVTSLGSAG
jgi:hypothetical protein